MTEIRARNPHRGAPHSAGFFIHCANGLSFPAIALPLARSARFRQYSRPWSKSQNTKRRITMPHAIRIHETGGPEVMRWEEVEVGQPAAGEVRVRNTAIGL